MTGKRGIQWTQGLHRALQQRPDHPATVFGTRTRTFRDQAARVARLAGGLHSLGVRQDDRVGILALNSDRYAEALLATGWADAMFNVLDTMRPAADLAQMLSEADTAVLFVDDTFATIVSDLRARWPGLTTVIHLGERPTPDDMINYEDLVSGSTPAPDSRRGGDRLAGLVHTSGTTDAPKAVAHTGDSLLSLVVALGATIPGYVAPGTRLLLATSMAHTSGVASVLAQSHFGGTLVALPRFDPYAVLETVEAQGITAMFVVPRLLERLVDHPDVVRRDLSSMHTIMYGAAPMTDSLLKRTSIVFPNARFGQIYGTTESLSCTFLTAEDHRPGPQRRSAGRAAVHAEARVVDDDDNDVPIGEVGEILLRGSGLMHGYWNDPGATADVLRGDWMHTGDVGRLDDNGYLYVVDRLQDVIIAGGTAVHSATVEKVLASHPDVAACAVIAVPAGEFGEQVHALVVLHPGASPDDDQLTRHCAARLACHQLPKSWEYVDSLPQTPMGEVHKQALRDQYWQGREGYAR